MADIRILKVGENDKITYGLDGHHTPQVEGLAALVQATINQLLTTPGTDAMSPRRGGGLAALCRRHRANTDRLKEAVADRVSQVEMQMREEQKELGLPPPERLAALDLISIEPGSAPNIMHIQLGIRTEAGGTARFQL